MRELLLVLLGAALVAAFVFAWPALLERVAQAGVPARGRPGPLPLLARRLLSVRASRQAPPAAELAERIEALLPQTQCTQCGYSGCKPYSQAIARGEADIDQCPPGGEAGVRALAELLGREPKPVNPAHGLEKPAQVALVREAECIGCTKCIQACPVDAIVGASKLMHTVIAELCTGCELCLPPCPVDCIDLVPVTAAAPGSPAPSAG
jgi:electron transport complex protein RnfB